MAKLITCVVLMWCLVGFIVAYNHKKVWGVWNREDRLLASEMIVRSGRLGEVTTHDYVYTGLVS